MRHRSHLSERERRCTSKLIALLKQGRVLKGTTYVLRNTCGKPNCKCARGEKHETLYAARSRHGKRQARSVPKPLRDQVLKWIERYNTIDELLGQLSDESWHQLEKLSKELKER